jgi:hypothetical protein
VRYIDGTVNRVYDPWWGNYFAEREDNSEKATNEQDNRTTSMSLKRRTSGMSRTSPRRRIKR